MANWKEYTTKTTPEDADEIMIADSKANASKRTPFSGLWNWIANKLATAVISQLETQSKSIIPALNELNSKCSAFTNTLTKNNTDKIDIELPSSRKVSSPFILIILNWVTGKCDIILGAYRNKDYEQVPVIAVDTTGEATISFTDGILTLKFTKRHSCLVAYY